MRGSGILMHISSLPSKYGIGTMGEEAYKFVDFLAAAKQSYWQILPIGPTSYGDSPYQSFSTHAGNPYFIDLDMLAEDGLLKKSDYAEISWGEDETRVDYENMYKKRFKVLRLAFEAFKKTDMSDFEKFLADNENWISNYALFMTAKEKNDGKSWLEWKDEGLRRRDPGTLWRFKNENMDEVVFWEFLQYKFFGQWKKLRAYANENGIRIIGDIPIYVAPDSAPVWVWGDLFKLDKDLKPTAVAGCPPDAFSPTGQLWGNPIYNWSRHRETGYEWWIDRMRAACELYDVVRIDHFRGFAGYYSVPYGDKTAENGKWEKGPGIELFNVIESKMGRLPIIAEDLGFLDDDVKTMLRESGFPGMKVLEFAFDPSGGSDYLTYKYDKNSAAYIGTHDNDTALGWLKSMGDAEKAFCAEYVMANKNNDKDIMKKLIGAMFASVSDTVILQMQDCLELGSEARMNVPSILGGNWQWRMKHGAATQRLAKKLARLTEIYGRSI